MAKPAKPSASSSSIADMGSKNRQTSKLSSGILGMKFMQQDEPEEASNEGFSEPTDSDRGQPQRGYHAEEDPGQWFAPGVSGSTGRSGVMKNTSSIGYAEIYGKSSSLGGRRTYGARPRRVDAEEMVRHYGDGEKQNKRNDKKSDKKKTANRKRLSSEHAEETRSDTRKQRRRS